VTRLLAPFGAGLFAFVLLLMLMLAHGAQAASPVYAPVVPGRALEFPTDHGSHPDFRTEWWYITGSLQTA
jgi:predicted secreted hydrolase